MRALRFGALLVLIAAAFGAVVSVTGGSERRSHVTTTATVGMMSITPNASIQAMIGQGYPVFQGAAGSGYTLTSPNAGAITSWSFLSAGSASLAIACPAARVRHRGCDGPRTRRRSRG